MSYKSKFRGQEIDELLSKVATGGGEGGNCGQVEKMPEPGEQYLNKIVQYVGPTDALYTNGYFYKCIQTATQEVIITTIPTADFVADAVDINIQIIKSILAKDAEISGELSDTCRATYNAIKDLWIFPNYGEFNFQTTNDLGLVITGNPVEGDYIDIKLVLDKFIWENIQVQEGGDGGASNAKDLTYDSITAQAEGVNTGEKAFDKLFNGTSTKPDFEIKSSLTPTPENPYATKEYVDNLIIKTINTPV